MSKKKAGALPHKGAKPAKTKKSGKQRTPTKRQIDLIKGIVAGKSTRQAALAAGYAPNSAEHAGALLSSEVLRGFCQKRLSIDKILARVDEGMDATTDETIIVGRKGKEKISFRQAPDFGERRQAAALAAKLIGADPANKIEVSGEMTAKVQIEYINVAALQEP